MEKTKEGVQPGARPRLKNLIAASPLGEKVGGEHEVSAPARSLKGPCEAEEEGGSYDAAPAVRRLGILERDAEEGALM